MVKLTERGHMKMLKEHTLVNGRTTKEMDRDNNNLKTEKIRNI